MTDNTHEEWRDIKGYEGLYQVSNLGNVKKLSYIRSDGQKHKERFIKPHLRHKGNYVCVYLNDRQGNRKCRSLPVLVLIAFDKIPPKDLQKPLTRHLDGDVWNNRVDNLDWVLRKNYFMPENVEARRLFNEYVYDYMERAANTRKAKGLCLGYYDINDLYQETALKVWRDIDTFDPSKGTFLKFVALRFDRCFATAYKRIVDKYRRCLSLDETISINRYNQYLKEKALPW